MDRDEEGLTRIGGVLGRAAAVVRSLSERSVWGVLLVLCVVSRAAAAIYYIADPDSLRFALSIIDYDLEHLQPHFPGYPIFSLIVKAIYLFNGSFALAFAIVGGMATVLVIAATLAIAGEKPRSPRGITMIALLFFNPMIWIMGERYMPDLLGLACALWAFHMLVTAADDPASRRALAGVVLAGVLAGIRLSYLPLLLLPLLDLLRRRPDRLRLMAAGIGAVALWLVPLLVITGTDVFLHAARAQTSGHFTEFGGTIETEPDLLLRTIRLLKAALPHGLGFFWPERHPATVVPTLGLGAALLHGAMIIRRHAGRREAIALGSVAIYTLWIFLFQNVVHQSRHLLPLIPFLLVAIATGGVAMISRGASTRMIFMAGLLGYALVTAELVDQHRTPTAIAQVTSYLRARAGRQTDIVADSLVAFMLQRQGVAGRYHEAPAARRDSLVEALGGSRDLVIIGDVGSSPLPFRSQSFFHNPYVNPVWPAITLHERE
jgi:hypothetical protein